MPFDLLSNPKLTENNLAQLGSTAFECLQAELIRATSKEFANILCAFYCIGPLTHGLIESDDNNDSCSRMASFSYK
jgi:hypothetical protein